MRKMTKTAVTLAAMSAMTVAAASMAFAAEKQEPNISSIAKQVETVNSSAVGEWSGSDVDGWKFTKEGGTKLKDQWAEIDGVWYYFIGEKMAQDRFLTLDNKGYFFDHTGRLATGWQRITSDMDAYSDIEVAEGLYNSYSNYYVHVNDNAEYDYHDYVWCYFDNSGVAKHNEWFQDGSGLWYYFDGDVMVKNVYNYRVRPDNYDAANSRAFYYYGFDEDGAMLVGWNYKEAETTLNDPTADDKGRIWYYYSSNGRMQEEGWKFIDGNWYLFAGFNADYNYAYKPYEVDGVGTREDDKWMKNGYPLIVNSYIASYNKNKYEYFYVDKDGKMVIGVKEVPKGAYKVLFYTDPDANPVADWGMAYELVKTDKAVTVNFGSKGAATAGKEDNRYYVLKNQYTLDASFDDVWKVNNSIYNAETSFDGFAPKKDYEWNFSQPGDNLISADDKSLAEPDDVIVELDKVKKYEEQIATVDGQQAARSTDIATFTMTMYWMKDTKANNTLIDKATNIYNEITMGSTSLNKQAIDALKKYNNALENMDKDAIPYINGAIKNKDGDEVYSANTYWTTGKDSDAVTSNPYVRSTDEKVLNVDDTIKFWEAQAKADQTRIVDLTKYGDAEARKEIPTLEKAVENAKFVIERLGDVKAAIEDKGKEKYEVNKAYAEYEAAYKALTNKITELENVQKEIRAAGIYIDNMNGTYTLQPDSTMTAKMTNNFAVRGELVKEAFIGQGSYVYFADNNGDLVANKAVVIDTDANFVPYGDSVTYQNVYILFGSDGKGIYDYNRSKKSISIGGVTYWSTDKTVKIGEAEELTIFVSNKPVDTKNNGNPQR